MDGRTELGKGPYRELMPPEPPPPLTPGEAAATWEPVMGEMEEMARGGTVTLLVNDATRPPSAPMLRPLADILRGRVRVLFATGSHRAVKPEEVGVLLGGLFEGASMRSSDCDSGSMVRLGETSRGTPVSVDPWVAGGTPVVSVNSVEPHYFAGFTGGRKSLLPGSCARETIEANHFLACLPDAEAGRLEGNPVHEDMTEALALVESVTRVVQGNGVFAGGELVHLSCGSCAGSFAEAVRVSSALSGVRPGRRYGTVVLHPGSPLDVSLYQAEKAWYNCWPVVRPGGEMLLVSGCREGLGAGHMEGAFVSSMDPGWVPHTRETYRLGEHSIPRIRRMRESMTLSLASGLDPALLARMGIRHVPDPDRHLSERDPDDVLVIRRAGFVVPELEG